MPSDQTNPTASLSWDLVLDLAAQPAGPLYQRLARAIRDAIKSGRAPGGAALPPSRQLATDLGVSRATVTEAYGQLIAEGYLEARSGSMTRVRSGLIDLPTSSPRPQSGGAPAVPTSTTRGDEPPPSYDLRPGLPDLRAFPRMAWVDAGRRALGAIANADLAAAIPFGHPRARATVASYLRRSRDAAAIPDHSLMVSSATAAMALLCRALLTTGRTTMAVEDPSWPQLRTIAEEAGLRIVSLPVDEDGARVDLLDQHRDVDVVLLTPAHQFPTGVALSPERRAAALEWARRTDGVIIEDDYDAAFRYDRRQIAALQGMGADRVVLLGSLSKTLSPVLGLGWMVLPPLLSDLVTSTAEAKIFGPGTLDTLTLAEFIESGRLDQQLRMLRQRYRSRRDQLVTALERHLPDLSTSGLSAGLHLVLQLPPGTDTTSLVARAAQADVGVVALDRYRSGSGSGPAPFDKPSTDSGSVGPPALVLGYGNLRDALVEEAVSRLASVLGDDPVPSKRTPR